MGQVLPIREGWKRYDRSGLYWDGYNKAFSSPAPGALGIPRQQALIILIEGIVDGAAREIRDVKGVRRLATTKIEEKR
jgi:hypothetical protein